MSRCFTFPPPGYENKPKAENFDLLNKEKRKEKKHKKEKKEKEKTENKEKKEKDRSKDKRKEKKDKKEKHRDRKKDKSIDKGRSSEDGRAEDRNEGTQNWESLQMVEEGKDSKFAEELGRRIRDNGSDNQMAGGVTTSVHGKIVQMGVARPSPEKDSRVADKKVFPVPIGRILPVDNATNSPHSRTGNISTATTTLDREKSKLSQRFTVGINTDQNKIHGISRSSEGLPGSVNRKAIGSTAAGMEKEKKNAERNSVSNSIAPTFDNNEKLGAKVASSNPTSIKRKNDFLGVPAESLSSIHSKPEPMGNSFIQSRMDGMGAVPAINKERVKDSGMLPHPFSSDQRRNTTNFQPVQKDKNQKVNKQDEVTKGLKDKEHSAKTNKPKDTDKYTKEEEEKIAKKAAVNENNKVRDLGKKDQIDALNSNKPLAPHRDNTAGIRGVDETSIKKKNLKINGFIQENDARPNKIPRMMVSSSQPLSGLPLKPDRILLDHKEKEINGSAKPQQSPDGNCEVSLKSPHPDSKYLEQIYAVPNMEPCLENDDMEWLFGCCDSSQQKPKRQPPPVSEESTSQAWSQALWIESADVLALPYVVPF